MRRTFFKKEAEAIKCKAQLESKYRGNRMYKVKLEEQKAKVNLSYEETLKILNNLSKIKKAKALSASAKFLIRLLYHKGDR